MNRKWIMFNLILKKNGRKRANYLKKKRVFHNIGSNCYYHPVKIPAEPWLISMGDNVFVGTNVLFITHNMANCVFNNLYGDSMRPLIGKIDMGNNIFIGANSIIMYNVKIGSNVIIGAGSIVTKDIPDNTVAAGIPAKVIGSFDEQYKKMKEFNEKFPKNKTNNQREIEEGFFYKK